MEGSTEDIIEVEGIKMARKVAMAILFISRGIKLILLLTYLNK